MFTTGFLKVAVFDHNNQGLEFKTSDQTFGNVGPGGMGPSGDATYQPVEPTLKSEPKVPKKLQARRVIQKLYKHGSGMESAALSDSGGSDIASTTVDQLKWTSKQGDTLEEEEAKDKESKNKRKSYIRARLRE